MDLNMIYLYIFLAFIVYLMSFISITYLDIKDRKKGSCKCKCNDKEKKGDEENEKK